MSRQTKNGRCSCWTAVDRKLAESDDCLEEVFTISAHHYLAIRTGKRDNKKGKAKLVVATYCPFCGAKLKEQ